MTSGTIPHLDPALVASITDAIALASKDLQALSLSIHSHPELGYEEIHAHEVLTDFMETKGFRVTRHAYGLETAWKAEFEVGTGGAVIGINSESELVAWQILPSQVTF